MQQLKAFYDTRGPKSPILLDEFLMEEKETIATKTASLLKDDTFFLVDVVISGNRNKQKVKVLVDGDQGINIDDCASLSRALSAWLDEENLFDQNYVLEVSSPGVDHPLKLWRQYNKNIGRNVKVNLIDDTTIEGKLIEADNTTIIVEQKLNKKEKKKVTIPFDNIDKTKVLISFKRDG